MVGHSAGYSVVRTAAVRAGMMVHKMAVPTAALTVVTRVVMKVVSRVAW